MTEKKQELEALRKEKRPWAQQVYAQAALEAAGAFNGFDKFDKEE